MKTNLRSIIGSDLRKHRQRKGLTQMQVAKAMGFNSSQFIALIEQGKSKVPFDLLGKLGAYLEFNPGVILELFVEEFSAMADVQVYKAHRGFKAKHKPKKSPVKKAKKKS